MIDWRAAIKRTVAFLDVCDYAPTLGEAVAWADAGEGEVEEEESIRSIKSVRSVRFEYREEEDFEAKGWGAVEKMVREKELEEMRGRIFFPGRAALVVEHERREKVFARKWRRARRVARYLARIGGVRFVALCNTTALSHGREESDLDFFIVTRAGTLWQTRAWSVLPFRLFNRRPRTDRAIKDAICLSFFVTDRALDLSPLKLPGDDVYFRHWFLQLLPLYDDGVGRELWEANELLRQRHPLAPRWELHPALALRPRLRIATPSWLEWGARALQLRTLGDAIRQTMNRDTRVVINDDVLKFHVADGRERFRTAYVTACERYNLEA